MLKIVYRIIILVGVFIASLFYFGRDIKEVVFDTQKTIIMEEATFPLVTLKTGEDVVNLLYGYSSNLDANVIRDSLMPVKEEQSFDVYIDQKDYEVKKLNYEIRNFVGNELIETDSVSVFDQMDDQQIRAKVRVKTKLDINKEYAVKIALVTSESKKMHYYFRMQKINSDYLSSQIDFVMNFHDVIQDKENAETIIDYLEPKGNANNITFSHVNINSSFDLVSWGNLKPKVTYEYPPRIYEINGDLAILELEFIVESEASGAVETYHVKEVYRVRYTKNRMYLLNYDRYMESVFDINRASKAKSELKLGITSIEQVPNLAKDQKKFAFVRNRELWFYNLEENEMTRVFSFRKTNSEDIRNLYDQHDIRILDMDAEGNLDFMVYGYMNRGQYEGRVGVILYRYHRTEERIEELVYLPMEESYETLKENLGEFAYVNNSNVFYFYVHNTIYSYNIITSELTTIANHVKPEKLVYLDTNHSIAWQETKGTNQINILELESGERNVLGGRDGYKISLLGKIDTNIIYGFVKESDIIVRMDGSQLIPYSVIEITSVDKKVLKSYNKAGNYITDINVKDNVVELTRVKKGEGSNAFVATTQDYIMNQEKTSKPIISITSRVTEDTLTELYLTLPSEFVMTNIPKLKETVNTIISSDPTVRIPLEGLEDEVYYSYVKGEIKGAHADLTKAITIANEEVGVVGSSLGYTVWERGVRANMSTISKIENMDISYHSSNSLVMAIDIMISYQGVIGKGNQISLSNNTAMEVLEELSPNPPINLSGLTLDQVLYYVSMGRPVIGLTDEGEGLLIYGYDTFNILLINPKTKSKSKMGLKDSSLMFENAGNIFISYLEK